MIFGKIDYLNLLPFYLFMKRHAPSQVQAVMRHKRGVPSKINQDFAARRVDAAFISSITAARRRHAGLGIIARKEVLSVLLVPGENVLPDSASATSNILAQVLGLQGEVIIGDRALKHYLSGGEAVDLAALWHERYGLPFVFALLCYHRHGAMLARYAKRFRRTAVKIPRYELQKAADRTGIAPDDILHYLRFISYDLDAKALRGYKKFQRLASARML